MCGLEFELSREASLGHEESAPGHVCAGGQWSGSRGMASWSSVTGRGREGGNWELMEPEVC